MWNPISNIQYGSQRVPSPNFLFDGTVRHIHDLSLFLLSVITIKIQFELQMNPKRLDVEKYFFAKSRL